MAEDDCGCRGEKTSHPLESTAARSCVVDHADRAPREDHLLLLGEYRRERGVVDVASDCDDWRADRPESFERREVSQITGMDDEIRRGNEVKAAFRKLRRSAANVRVGDQR